jgi:hypothetical protein
MLHPVAVVTTPEPEVWTDSDILGVAKSIEDWLAENGYKYQGHWHDDEPCYDPRCEKDWD